MTGLRIKPLRVECCCFLQLEGTSALPSLRPHALVSPSTWPKLKLSTLQTIWFRSLERPGLGSGKTRLWRCESVGKLNVRGDWREKKLVFINFIKTIYWWFNGPKFTNQILIFHKNIASTHIIWPWRYISRSFQSQVDFFNEFFFWSTLDRYYSMACVNFWSSSALGFSLIFDGKWTSSVNIWKMIFPMRVFKNSPCFWAKALFCRLRKLKAVGILTIWM